MNGLRVLSPLLLTALAAPAWPQTAREQAVAIDRVAVPPADRFEVEQIGPPMASPWSLAFLPDGSFLVTEKHGGVRIIRRDGSASGRLAGGPPNVLQKADSGLLDVVLDPEFTANRMVYIAFAEGTNGPCRDYLANTIEHLRELKIPDRELRQLWQRVIDLRAQAGTLPRNEHDANA